MPAQPPVQTRKNLSAKATWHPPKPEAIDKNEPIVPETNYWFQFELPFTFNIISRELMFDFENNEIRPYDEDWSTIEKVMEFIEYRKQDLIPYFYVDGKPIPIDIWKGFLIGQKFGTQIIDLQAFIKYDLDPSQYLLCGGTFQTITVEYRGFGVGSWKKDKGKWYFKKPYQ